MKDIYKSKVNEFISQINDEMDHVQDTIEDLSSEKKKISKQLDFQRDKYREWGKLKDDLQFLIREEK